MIYLVHSEIPLDDFDLVQSSLEGRVVPGGRDQFEFVLCCGFPLDDELPVEAGVPALVRLEKIIKLLNKSRCIMRRNIQSLHGKLGNRQE